MSLRNKLEGVRAIWRFDNKWELLLSRTLYRSHSLTVYRFGGMEILVDHGADDPSGLRKVLVSPMYRQFLGRIEARGPLNVLDVGASSGGFPLLLRASGLHLKRLGCVELNPNTFSRMRFNIERNLECAFVAVPAAVCGHRCSLDVVLGPGSTGDSIEGSPGGAGRQYRVPGITFDDAYRKAFDDETVDVCKIDIEGAEYEVFDNPGHDCLTRCRYLIIEIHRRDGRRPEEVLAELARCGFAPLARNVTIAPDVYFLGRTAAG